MDHCCPECADTLMICELRAGIKVCHCSQCHRDWTYQAQCPECSAEVEVLKACGAVQFFCATCRRQVGKSTASWQLKR